MCLQLPPYHFRSSLSYILGLSYGIFTISHNCYHFQLPYVYTIELTSPFYILPPLINITCFIQSHPQPLLLTLFLYKFLLLISKTYLIPIYGVTSNHHTGIGWTGVWQELASTRATPVSIDWFLQLDTVHNTNQFTVDTITSALYMTPAPVLYKQHQDWCFLYDTNDFYMVQSPALSMQNQHQYVLHDTIPTLSI